MCPPGTKFVNGVCTQCEGNSISRQYGSTECAACDTNLVANAAKTDCVFADVIICADGYIVADFEGYSVCEPCGVGKFGANGTCFDCEDNYYSDQPDSAKCSTCPIGYVHLADHGSCRPCEPGSFHNGDQCEFCDAEVGDFQPLPGKTECERCNFQTRVVDGIHGISCGFDAVCPVGEGLTGASDDSSNCVTCPVGYFETSMACVSCPVGYYQPENGQGTCLRCGETTKLGATGCGDLPFACPNGMELQEDSHCEACVPGTYLESETKLCRLCPVGTYSYKYLTHFECIPCGPGHFCPNEGMIRPLTCPIGNYCGSEVTVDPVMCPLDTFADFDGASVCYPCELGSISNEDRTGCVACPAGEYESESVCKICPEGTFTPIPGYAECLACASGFVNKDRNFCEPSCPSGHIRKSSQSDVDIESNVDFSFYIACEPCERGFYQSGNECLPCIAEDGQWNDFRGQSQCKICTGTVFDEARQCFDSSSICPAGHYNTGYDCKFCPSGTYQPFATSDDRCMPAGFGFYCPAEGMTSRKDCDAGYYCPNEYVVEPFICPAGYQCPVRTRDPMICNSPEDEECRYAFVLMNNEPGQSFCDFQCIKDETECSNPIYHIRVLIQADGTIRPEREFAGNLCVNSAVFEWGKAPIIGKCQPDKFFGQWEYTETSGAIFQWKAACQAREDGCSGAKTQMCWTVKTMGLDRRVTLDKCHLDCDGEVMVSHQRFIYQKGRVRLVDTDFCVAWYPNEKFLKLTECKFDIFG